MKRFYLLKLVLPIAIILGLQLSAFAQPITFSYTGSVQTYTVPAGVTSLNIDLAGAQGGNFTSPAKIGGKGGRVTGFLAVTPGQVLYIYIGQQPGASSCGSGGAAGLSSGGGENGGTGSSSAGQCGGAGAGGGTDIRTIAGDLNSRKMVGGGGGGSGYACGEDGGDAGGLTGVNGNYCGGASTQCGSGGTQTAGGAAGSPGAVAGSLGAGGNASNSFWGGGGGGGYYGGGGSYGGSGAGGSSYAGGAGVSGAVLTGGYNTGNGYVIICPVPVGGAISGTAALCPGGTSTLTQAGPAGGVWSSSAPLIASIGSSSGVVNAIAAGLASITYNASTACGTAVSTYTITVNPNPATIGGTLTVCEGGATTTLTDAAAGGTWTSANPSIATIGASSGVATGVASGGTPASVTITYTLPTTCSITTSLLVNPLPVPYTVTGGGNYCTGGSGVAVGLSGSTVGVNYQLFLGGTPVSSLSGTGSALNFGLMTATGTYTIVGTNVATGCSKNMTGTAVVGFNPNPAIPGGATSVCALQTAVLTDATPGGTWTSGNTTLATVGLGTGIVTGITAGTLNMTYTIGSTGCKSFAPFTVFAAAGAIGGTPSVCVGGNTTLTNTGGGTWTSSATGVATVGAGSGIVSGVAPGTTTITYALPTGCSNSISVVVNPLPIAYTVTGGGSYCQGSGGVHVGISYSNSGVLYQLYNGSTPIGVALNGSNSGLDFGAQTGPGTYTVTAFNPLTGCTSTMTGSVVVSINPLPLPHNVTGGGNICFGGAGLPIGLDGSDLGSKYQLYNGAIPVGPLVNGTGAGISFGSFTTPGTYTVVGIVIATGCTDLMVNNAVITINPLPSAYGLSVTNGGSYCAGGSGQNIMLSGSDPGVDYQLYLGGVPVLGGLLTGTGTALNFGLFTAPGAYTAKATDPMTGCTNNMLGSVNIVINPLPAAYNVTGGGQYCAGGAGLHVGLVYSSIGIRYYLWYGGVIIDSADGSGTSLDFGARMAPGFYTVTATNLATGCVNNMTGSANITINTPPVAYGVTGGGNYCTGGAGVAIGTDASDLGITYQLYRGITAIGLPVAGTGSPLNFGNFTIAGTYTIVAKDVLTSCMTNLMGSAVVGVNPLPTVYAVTGGGNYCMGGIGVNVNLSGSSVGTNYDLYLGGFIIPGTTVAGTGSAISFGLQTLPGVYTVVATDAVLPTACTKVMAGSATVVVNSLPIAYNVTGGGEYCSGGTGRAIGLDGSTAGIRYQLTNGSPSGTAMSGSGGVLNFGLRTASGNYTVVATNPLTGCSNTMNGSADIFVNPLPNVYPMSAGGSYCSYDPGIDVYLVPTDIGFDYQLYRGLTPVGALQSGTGDTLHFGPDTAGTYVIKATDQLTGCSRYMGGSTTVTKIQPIAYNVIGGGSYCAGGNGVNVGTSGSEIGYDYTLMLDGIPTGSTLSGSGTAMNFGLQTAAGVYTVIATNTLYGCVGSMNGNVSVIINPLPPVNTVTGGGIYCAGGSGVHVNLSLGNSGINYRLFNGVSPLGSSVSGAGSALDFGLVTTAGTYMAVATNATTGCSDTMAGSATVTIKALPTAYPASVTGERVLYPGYFCATDSGVHVYLPNSNTGVNYQLWRGTTMIGRVVAGTGSVVDFGLQNVAGSYNITATDTTAAPFCTNNMLGSAVVSIVPLPTIQNVTGGGKFCPGGVGVHIGLDGSEPGIIYNLWNGSTFSGSLAATGGALDFGVKDIVGTYTVIGTSSIIWCANNMFGTAVVAHDTIYTPNVVLRAFPGNDVGVWHIDSMRAEVTNGGTNPTFQWIINGHPIAGATNQSFTHYEFFNKDSVACMVTASGNCGGNTTTKSMIITLHTEGVTPVTAVNSQLMLIPNPNKGTFNVKGTLGTTIDEDVTLEVVNMLGQVIYSGKASSRNGSIDESVRLNNNPANGMYILNVRSNTQNSVFHFVIEQ